MIAGAAGAPQTQALISAALAAPDPAVCVLRAADLEMVSVLHPAHGKPAPQAGGAVAYVCRGGVCGLPLGDAAALGPTLRRRLPAVTA